MVSLPARWMSEESTTPLFPSSLLPSIAKRGRRSESTGGKRLRKEEISMAVVGRRMRLVDKEKGRVERVLIATVDNENDGLCDVFLDDGRDDEVPVSLLHPLLPEEESVSGLPLDPASIHRMKTAARKVFALKDYRAASEYFQNAATGASQLAKIVEEKQSSEGSGSSSETLTVGTRVVIRPSNGGASTKPGIISFLEEDDRTCDVIYDDGEEEDNVPFSRVVTEGPWGLLLRELDACYITSALNMVRSCLKCLPTLQEMGVNSATAVLHFLGYCPRLLLKACEKEIENPPVFVHDESEAEKGVAFGEM